MKQLQAIKKEAYCPSPYKGPIHYPYKSLHMVPKSLFFKSMHFGIVEQQWRMGVDEVVVLKFQNGGCLTYGVGMTKDINFVRTRAMG